AIIEANRKKYRGSDFEKHYPQIAEFAYLDIPLPEEAELTEEADDILFRRRFDINPMINKLYLETPEKDWSGALWRLCLMLFEAGFTRTEVFTVAMNAQCNKYVRDGRDPALLWKDVCRAGAKHDSNQHTLNKK